MTADRDRDDDGLERAGSLADQAYCHIRDGLLPGGKFAGAPRLAERDVAAHLQMSRTPVRDALRKLAREGLIERTPNGGYSPKRISFRAINEIFELRRAVEPYAARLAAANAMPRDLEKLRVNALNQHSGTGRFHIAVGEASQNAVLVRVIEEINVRLPGQREYIPPVPAGHNKVHPDHMEILSEIENRDQDAAALAMEDHLASVYDATMKALRSLKVID